jgi:hypothetical protein
LWHSSFFGLGQIFFNPNGIEAFSPALPRLRLRWVTGQRVFNPERVASVLVALDNIGLIQPFQG